MATDYVRKRPKPRAKPNKKRSTKSGSNSSSMPWVKLLIACILLAGFGFALYKLANVNTDSDDVPVTPSDIETNPQNNKEQPVEETPSLEETDTKSDLDPLPVLESEEWAYIDSLPDYEVEVDTKEALKSNREFIMQCGSFRTTARAQELKAKIAFQNLEARIIDSNGKNGLWYRVLLGPYETKRDAERHRHYLRNANIRGCKIW